jgi:hemerythrin-like domain-containing protein
MNPAKCDGHDGVLTAALAEIIAHLRLTSYGGIAAGLDPALRGAADEFVAKLASHLRHEEETLFPAIRRSVPGAGPEVDRLVEEHELIRVYATDLAHRIKARDTEGAIDLSRAFLAALFDHIERERKVSQALEGIA